MIFVYDGVVLDDGGALKGAISMFVLVIRGNKDAAKKAVDDRFVTWWCEKTIEEPEYNQTIVRGDDFGLERDERPSLAWVKGKLNTWMQEAGSSLVWWNSDFDVDNPYALDASA